ncbi:MAG: hypothetical protein ACOZCO_10555 [Bacteroidota bacterium]
MKDQKKKADQEFFKFLQTVLDAINNQPAQPTTQFNQNIHVTVVVNEPQKGWLRRQLAKLW